MEKVDPKILYKAFYNPKRNFEIINISKMNFLSIIGEGNPNISHDYSQSIGAIYSVAYGLKFYSKKKYGKDFVIGPLEALWWAEDWADFAKRLKENWKWELLIWQPDWINQDDFSQIIMHTKIKKPNPKLELIKLRTIEEGQCVQILHIGSYDDEAPTLAKMHNEFIPNNGLKLHGLHHEIYLSDPRKTAPEKLKTILRQPVLKV